MSVAGSRAGLAKRFGRLVGRAGLPAHPLAPVAPASRSAAPVRLRRADWRFLLPAPPEGFEHLVLLGGPPSLGGQLVRLGLARRVSDQPPLDRSADAIAILAGATVHIRDAVACLRPGGALYVEVDRRSPRSLGMTPDRLARTLRRANLTPTGGYWVKPDFERAEMFLPFEAPGAFD